MKKTETEIDINLIDWGWMAEQSKSHSAEDLRRAIEMGDNIWSFDSGTSGKDDLLIYPAEVGKEEIMANLEEFFETGEFADPPTESAFAWDMPNHWSLTQLSFCDLLERWRAE